MMLLLLSMEMFVFAKPSEDVLLDDDFLGDDESALLQEDDPKDFHWQDDHTWIELRLHRPVMSITATWNDRLLALDDEGRIFRLNADGSWKAVFADDMKQVDEEELLLNLESTLGEQWEVTDDGSYDSDSVDTDSVSNEWESAIDDPLLLQEGFEGIYSIWTDERSPLVFACWQDGCVRSDDNGDSWESMGVLPPAEDFAVMGNVYVAGTPNGLWFSTDKGKHWKRQLEIPRDLDVHNFAMNKDNLVAGTSSGVWFSKDGLKWREQDAEGFDDVEFTSMLLSIYNELWAMCSLGFVYSNDLGQTIGIQRGQVEFHTMLTDEWNGGLLAFGEELVWESIDNAKSWQILDNDLPVTIIHDAVDWKGSFVIATDQGVFYLGKSTKNEEILDFAQTTVTAVDIEQMISATTREIDREIEMLSVDRATKILRWVPTVNVNYSYGHDRSITANYDSIYTYGIEQKPWSVTTNMCFGNCQTSSTDIGQSASTDITDDIMVIGDSVYRSDIGGVVPAAGNVSLQLQAMRRARTQQIIDLYTAAIRLEQQQALFMRAPLSDQVMHQIEQEEVAALLDLYTDGKFSESMRGLNTK